MTPASFRRERLLVKCRLVIDSMSFTDPTAGPASAPSPWTCQTLAAPWSRAQPMGDIISISVFYEFAVLLVLAAMVGLAGLALRQPLIVSFIAVGSLAGPSVLNVARPDEHIEPCCCSWSGSSSTSS
jgi:hypothetical protein